MEKWNHIVSLMGKDIENNLGIVLVAEIENIIIGQAGIFLGLQKSEHIGNFGILLVKNYRNQGLGTKLSQILIQEAKSKFKGLECIELGVFADNIPALGLYRKLGFEEVALIPRKFKFKDQYSDEILMQLWV